MSNRIFKLALHCQNGRVQHMSNIRGWTGVNNQKQICTQFNELAGKPKRLWTPINGKADGDEPARNNPTIRKITIPTSRSSNTGA